MATLNTVLGPIDASQIGGTMSHVHLTINILCWHQTPDSGVLRGLSESKITMQNLGLVRRNAMLFKDNLVQDDLDLATREAAEYKFAGGQTLINVDLPGMGRDPLALQKIARATGLKSRAAASIPRCAISMTQGSVTLQSANVLVRPTAPGIFVTQ